MTYKGNGYGRSGNDAPNTTNVSMRLSTELVNRLDDEASSRNVSRTFVIEHALREYYGLGELNGVSIFDRASNLEQRMSRVEQDDTSLIDRMNNLEKRVAQLEQSLTSNANDGERRSVWRKRKK